MVRNMVFLLEFSYFDKTSSKRRKIYLRKYAIKNIKTKLLKLEKIIKYFFIHLKISSYS